MQVSYSFSAVGKTIKELHRLSFIVIHTSEDFLYSSPKSLRRRVVVLLKTYFSHKTWLSPFAPSNRIIIISMLSLLLLLLYVYYMPTLYHKSIHEHDDIMQQ